MAIVKTIKEKITTDTHMCNSVDYITKKHKAYKVSFNLCITNTPDKITTEFRNTRIAFNKNKGILGHQLVQSFSKDDNVTPEQAHQIGLELMERCLSNYQLVMATHIDGEYIHNQFIINSVSPFDGMKFADNKNLVNMIRRVSDEICLNNDLSIVEKGIKSKYVGLDAPTLNLAKRGSSWKFNLVKDLDTALDNCNSKDDFIKFFEDNDYEIKFTPKNISFKKVGEKKSIRADTLAKQFGQKYSKASIEKKLNIKNKNKEDRKQSYTPPSPNLDYYNQIASEEWKRYERKYKNKIRFNDNRYFDRVLFSRNPLIFSLRLIRYIFNKSKKKAKGKIGIGYPKQYKIKIHTDYKKAKTIVGNIPYKTIINTAGEAVKLKLYAWQIAKLLHNNVLLSSVLNINDGTGILTIKKTDIPKVAKILQVSSDSLYKQSEEIQNKKQSYELHKKNGKLNYLVITKEQVELLKYNCIKFASYPKGEKFNIAYAPSDKDKILSILFPNRKDDNTDTFFKRNSALNKKLKEQSAETGEKLCYKIVLSEQYKALRNTTIEFAVFRQNDGKYNVVFLEHNKTAIEKAIGGKTDVETNTAQTKPTQL